MALFALVFYCPFFNYKFKIKHLIYFDANVGTQLVNWVLQLLNMIIFEKSSLRWKFGKQKIIFVFLM